MVQAARPRCSALPRPDPAVPDLQCPPPAAELKPKHGLLAGVYDTIGMVDSASLRGAFKSGALAGRRARVEGLEPGAVRLDDGSTLPVRACWVGL